MAKKRVILHCYDPRAVKLIQDRAERENRSLSNAMAQTVIESLGNPQWQHTSSDRKNQR